jgi:cytochrome P450
VILRSYGEITHFKIGNGHVYLINNPDYIGKILIYNHKNFKKGKRLQTAKRLLGEGLVTSEGEKHDGQRKIIHPLFLPENCFLWSNRCRQDILNVQRMGRWLHHGYSQRNDECYSKNNL